MTRRHECPVWFAGHGFDLDIDDSFRSTQLAHLAGFLPAPSSAPTCPHPPTRIVVRHDPGQIDDRLHALRKMPSRTIVAFRGEPYRCRKVGDVSWWSPSPDVNLPEDHLYAREPTGPVHVLVRPGAERGERYLMRVIRETVLRCQEERGWAVFHAAATAVGDRGILIAGPSGAGKTTVLTALAAHAGADLIASDRAAVTDGAAFVVGAPLSVRIAAGTLSAVPADTSLTRTPLPPAVFGSGFKVAVSPADFGRAFGTSVVETAALRLVLLPRLTDDGRRPTALALGADTARRLLTSACCTPRDEDWLCPWLADRPVSIESLAEQATRLIDSVVASVPVIRLQAGVRSGHLMAQISDLILRTIR